VERCAARVIACMITTVHRSPTIIGPIDWYRGRFCASFGFIRDGLLYTPEIEEMA
jgi:hypothetical protein